MGWITVTADRKGAKKGKPINRKITIETSTTEFEQMQQQRERKAEEEKAAVKAAQTQRELQEQRDQVTKAALSQEKQRRKEAEERQRKRRDPSCWPTSAEVLDTVEEALLAELASASEVDPSSTMQYVAGYIDRRLQQSVVHREYADLDDAEKWDLPLEAVKSSKVAAVTREIARGCELPRILSLISLVFGPVGGKDDRTALGEDIGARLALQITLRENAAVVADGVDLVADIFVPGFSQSGAEVAGSTEISDNAFDNLCWVLAQVEECVRGNAVAVMKIVRANMMCSRFPLTLFRRMLDPTEGAVSLKANATRKELIASNTLLSYLNDVCSSVDSEDVPSAVNCTKSILACCKLRSRQGLVAALKLLKGATEAPRGDFDAVAYACALHLSRDPDDVVAGAIAGEHIRSYAPQLASIVKHMVRSKLPVHRDVVSLLETGANAALAEASKSTAGRGSVDPLKALISEVSRLRSNVSVTKDKLNVVAPKAKPSAASSSGSGFCVKLLYGACVALLAFGLFCAVDVDQINQRLINS